MGLDKILAEGVVPYRDNFTCLERLEAQAPGRFGLEAVYRFELGFNYVFHESAHCLAHREFAPITEKSRSFALLKILLGEAFANTAECLSSAFVTGEIGAYFLKANAHFTLDLEDSALLIRVAREIGFQNTAKALIYSFFYSNSLYLSLGEAERRSIAALAEIKTPPGGFERLTDIALSLSERFRTETSFLYLIKLGFSQDDFALFQQDPAITLASEEAAPLKESVANLAALLTKNCDQEFS